MYRLYMQEWLYDRSMEDRNMNRQAKRKKLIKTLAYKIIEKYCPNQNIKVRINIDSYRPCHFAFWNEKEKLTKGIILLNLKFIKYKVKAGYSNSYYIERTERLECLLNNRKANLYFIILHELKHCMDYIENINARKLYGNSQLEYNADSFALEHLNEYINKKELITV
jgi:hypothetical protein